MVIFQLQQYTVRQAWVHGGARVSRLGEDTDTVLMVMQEVVNGGGSGSVQYMSHLSSCSRLS
jgi:hypothetical protein